jgi:Cu2+-exporting ATPase
LSQIKNVRPRDAHNQRVASSTRAPARPHAVQGSTLAVHAASRCFHCGSDNPSGSSLHAVIDGMDADFCCAGCLAVAQTIRAAGLVAFYRRRDADAPRDSAAVTARDASFDAEAAEAAVETIAPNECETALLVEGVRCGGCV